MIKKYFRIWTLLTFATTQLAFASRFGATIFIFGKLMRFFIFLAFFVLIVNRTKNIAGYTYWQIILFYATYSFIDALPQLFLREVYRFRNQIVNGYFDYTLSKPYSPLFKALLGGSDFFDLFTLAISAGLLFLSATHLGSITALDIVLFCLPVGNACIIALAFHIVVLSIGMLTTEVDNTMMQLS